MLENDIKKILVSHDEITEAAKKLGAQLTKDYAGKNPILIVILKGSIPFMAELVKHIDTQMCIRDRVIMVSSLLFNILEPKPLIVLRLELEDLKMECQLFTMF